MNKTILILSVFALIAGCCGQSSNKQAKTANNEVVCEQSSIVKSRETNDPKMTIEQRVFDDYLKAISEVKFPLQFKCEIDPNASNSNIDRTTIAKYTREHSDIYGKLAVNENYAAIIYLYPADVVLPIIQTYDRQGNKISELTVYDRYCGANEFFWCTSWASILEDLTIVLSDSTRTYDRNLEGKIIEETIMTEVRHRKFYINNKGEINEKMH